MMLWNLSGGWTHGGLWVELLDLQSIFWTISCSSAYIHLSYLLIARVGWILIGWVLVGWVLQWDIGVFLLCVGVQGIDPIAWSTLLISGSQNDFLCGILEDILVFSHILIFVVLKILVAVAL